MDRESLPLVTIFGASGFVGTQIVQVLARKGYRIRAAVRRPDLAQHLRPLGDVGQVVPVQANLRYPDSIVRAVHGAGVVINLVGIGAERGAQRFETVHVDGARAVAEAATVAGAPTLLHMSAIAADPESPSAYLRSKARGEEAVLEAFPQAVIFRPSLMFGPGDEFFNLMASTARLAPVMPLIGGKSRFQPIYVGDTADAYAAAVAGAVKGGKAYELGGPEVVTMRELVERILRVTHRSNPLLPLPAGIARALATVMGILPGAPLTPDRVTLLGLDNIVSQSAAKGKRTLAAFGVTPTPMDAILPSYLWRFRPHGQFDNQPA